MSLRIPIKQTFLFLLLVMGSKASAQITTTNPGEIEALGAGNASINKAVTSQMAAASETAALQNAMPAEFTVMKKWEKQYNSYLKTADNYASALKAATHAYADGVRIVLTLGKLKKAVSNNPQGVVASISMNNLYMETVSEMLSVYTLLKSAVAKGGSENMLTGAERSKTLWELEDKLSSFSDKLNQLYYSVRLYKMSDVWNRATAGMIDRDAGQLARQSLDLWKRKAKIAWEDRNQ